MNLSALLDTVKRARQPVYLSVFAAAVAALLVLAGWHQTATALASERMNRYGDILSAQLADLVVEPLLSGDRIRLSVIANGMADFDEVVGTAVYTVDDQLIAIGGETTSNPQLPSFPKPVAVQDIVAGHVRVTLEPDAFAVPFARKLWASSPWWLAAIVLAAVAGWISTLDRPRRRTDVDEDALPEPPPEPLDPHSVFLLVVNIFNQISLPSGQRAGAMEHVMRNAGRVANLYAARAMPLTGTGAILAFDQTETPDRPFEVLCAALLLRETLGAVNRDHYVHDQPEIRFRFGLHDGPVDDSHALLESDHTADTVLLSALAADGLLAVSDDVMAAIDRPERVRGTPTTNPAAEALTTTNSRFHVVEGVGITYQGLIERQAELIVAQGS